MLTELLVEDPESMDDACLIADCLKDGTPVFVRLPQGDEESAVRIFDFLRGVALGLEGRFERLGRMTYLCTPKEIRVSDLRGVQDEAES
ncbi:MAG: cell division protein SepF [bacterium]|nr:cell division protein SepF [bacterium]